MKFGIWTKRLLAGIASTVAGLIVATAVFAANPETVPVEVTFAAPVTITGTTSLQFGLLDVSMAASDTVTVNPDDSTSDPQSRIIGGTQAAATMTISALGATGITITADNPTNGTYYTLGSFVCNYDNGTDTACGSGYNVTSALGGSAPLAVGATLTGLGGASAGADNGSFEVTVIYQ